MGITFVALCLLLMSIISALSPCWPFNMNGASCAFQFRVLAPCLCVHPPGPPSAPAVFRFTGGLRTSLSSLLLRPLPPFSRPPMSCCSGWKRKKKLDCPVSFFDRFTFRGFRARILPLWAIQLVDATTVNSYLSYVMKWIHWSDLNKIFLNYKLSTIVPFNKTH